MTEPAPGPRAPAGWRWGLRFPSGRIWAEWESKVDNETEPPTWLVEFARGAGVELVLLEPD